MANWRRYHVESHSHEAWRSTPKNSQSYTRIQQPSVPSWEKRFCFAVGSVPWKRLLESQKFISKSDRIIQWNDFAGEKAFHDAKSRFWAMINGLPCKTSLPDPDMYIEKIDWTAKVDPELLSGLEVASDEVEDDDEDNVIDSICIPLDQIKPTGWDVVYSEEVEKPKLLTGMIVGDKTWENSRKILENLKGGSWNWEQWDNNYVGEGFEILNANYKKRIDGDHSTCSRYTKSRFHDYGNQRSCRWKY